VARYLSLIDSIECYGADVNPRLVEWCSQNVDNFETVVSGADPPLRFGDATFELVYALSVFTHLSEEGAERWLGELARVLKPGGLLLATTHGYASLVIRKTSSVHQVAGGLTEDGVDAILERLPVEEFIFMPYGAEVLARAQAGSAYGTAFIEPRWLRSHSSAAGLEIIDHVPAGLRGLQDLLILSRPKVASI
jgi:SAM-dependent methyltransferase